MRESLLQNLLESGQVTQEILVKEVAASLAQHRKLLDQANKLESEVTSLETKDKSPVTGSKSPAKSPRVSMATSPPLSGSKLSPKDWSPRFKSDVFDKKLSPRDGKDNLETFDAHLKSIITTALMGEPDLPKEKSSGSKDSLATRPPDRYNSEYTSPAKLHLKRLYPSEREEPGKPVDTAAGIMSLPVKIPLNEVPKPKCLPVSFPLSSVAEQGHRDSGKHGPKSPCARDVYSPISRPSSTSSTASAESVKHLLHGTLCTSPRSTCSSDLNDHKSPVSKLHPRSSQSPRIEQKQPAGQIPVSYPASFLTPSLSMLTSNIPPSHYMMASDKPPSNSHPGNPSHNPSHNPSLPSNHLSNHPSNHPAMGQMPYLAHSQMFDMTLPSHSNGISKTITAAAEEKGKRGRRKRTGSPASAQGNYLNF